MLYKVDKPKIEYKKFEEKDYFPIRNHKIATTAIHEGQEPEPIHGSVNIPIHLSSTYAQKDINEPFGEFDYTRGGNPTRKALENCIKGMEGADYCITYASGCGATASIFHTLKTGDHAISVDDVYGGTQRYMKKFQEDKYGVNVDFVDMTDVANIKKAVK